MSEEKINILASFVINKFLFIIYIQELFLENWE